MLGWCQTVYKGSVSDSFMAFVSQKDLVLFDTLSELSTMTVVQNILHFEFELQRLLFPDCFDFKQLSVRMFFQIMNSGLYSYSFIQGSKFWSCMKQDWTLNIHEDCYQASPFSSLKWTCLVKPQKPQTAHFLFPQDTNSFCPVLFGIGNRFSIQFSSLMLL